MSRIPYSTMVGTTVNQWNIVGLTPGHCPKFSCICSCGDACTVVASSVRNGSSKRCRRCRDAAMGRARTTHGACRRGAQRPEYGIWAGMLDRCGNENNTSYSDYGGRGIAVCPEWQVSFAAFFAYVGPRPTPEHSIDRYPDTNGNYEPGNVRWATDAEQARNRRSTRLITHDGVTLCLSDWAERLGLDRATLHERLAHGEPLELALTGSRRVERRCSMPGCTGRHRSSGLCSQHYQAKRHIRRKAARAA